MEESYCIAIHSINTVLHLHRSLTIINRKNMNNLSRAKLLAVVCRKLEQQKRRPLISDPQAGPLLKGLCSENEIAALEKHRSLESLLDIVAVSTHQLDIWLDRPSFPPLRTTRRQFVLIGSGVDTRPFRLGFSQYSHTVFEVDADDSLLQEKHNVLAHADFRPRCAVKLVGADPNDVGAIETKLISAGFDPRVPTRWLVEDTLAHMSPDARQALFSLASRMGGVAGSGFAAQLVDHTYIQHLSSILPKDQASSMLPPLENAHIAEDSLSQLADAGWTNVRARRQAELTEATGRSTHPGFALISGDADPLSAI